MVAEETQQTPALTTPVAEQTEPVVEQTEDQDEDEDYNDKFEAESPPKSANKQ